MVVKLSLICNKTYGSSSRRERDEKNVQDFLVVAQGKIHNLVSRVNGDGHGHDDEGQNDHHGTNGVDGVPRKFVDLQLKKTSFELSGPLTAVRKCSNAKIFEAARWS